MATIVTIQASDQITNSRADLNTNFANLNSDKIETSTLDTDIALAANSDLKIATQKAVKAYVDTGGNVNASETTRGIVEEATDAEVSAGTASGALAKLFITPTKLLTYLATRFAAGVPSKAMMMATIFETAGRFDSIVNSGTNTFGTAGVAMATTSTTTRAAGITWSLTNATNGNVFAPSPVFTTSIVASAVGTTGSSFFGLGLVTKDGTGHTYTTDHCGFKILISGSVATLYATQGDGSTETASSALTTLVVNDSIDLILKMNGASSIDYYWQKNDGGWSVATNLTTNIPNTANHQCQFSVSNNSTATAQTITVTSASFSK